MNNLSTSAKRCPKRGSGGWATRLTEASSSESMRTPGLVGRLRGGKGEERDVVCTYLYAFFLIYLLFHFFSRILFPIFVSFHLAQLCLNLVFCSVLFLLASSLYLFIRISPSLLLTFYSFFSSQCVYLLCSSFLFLFASFCFHFPCVTSFNFCTILLCCIFYSSLCFFFTSSLQLRYSLLI